MIEIITIIISVLIFLLGALNVWLLQVNNRKNKKIDAMEVQTHKNTLEIAILNTKVESEISATRKTLDSINEKMEHIVELGVKVDYLTEYKAKAETDIDHLKDNIHFHKRRTDEPK